MAIENFTVEAGYLVITTEPGGIPKRWAIADILRAADIPALTYSQVAAITTLANLVVILVRTLRSKGILNESFLEDDEMDLDHIIYTIEQMGGDYEDPNLHGV